MYVPKQKRLKTVRRLNWWKKQLLRDVLLKKVFVTIFKISLVIICAGVKRIWWRCFPLNFAAFLGAFILQNICERILAWNEVMKKCFHVNIFTEKHRWGCHLKCSLRYESLGFHLKGTQSQILSCKLHDVLQSFSFTEHYILLLCTTYYYCF